MSNELFIIATRCKYRFPYKGLITTEDLWDLTPTALDSVFKELNAKLKRTGEESLLQTEDKETAVLKRQIEIIKYILNTKLEEGKKREQAAANAAKRQHIMDILASKEDQALQDMSADDLRKMLTELE